MRVVNLRCEYLENPLGIDIIRPRLSWLLESDQPGACQTGYQVLCSSHSLCDGEKDLWDSGKVASDCSIQVEYGGPELQSGQRVAWKVRVWDQAGKPTEWSSSAFWEMGLLERGEWKGQWIGAEQVGGPRTSAPCPYLRKSFKLTKPLAAARLYITALGLYECEINSQPITENIFTPGWPDYRNRDLYQVYDVAGLLKDGENAIGVILGDGWYCGHVGPFDRQFYGDLPKLLAQLALIYTDGSQETVITDPTWKTSSGPILESDILMGECYDARRELPWWSSASFDDSGWKQAVAFADPGIDLVAHHGLPVRRTAEFTPVADPTSMNDWPYSRWIFNLGQNITGRVRLKVCGPRGRTIRLRFAEMLKADGSLYTENLRTARATDSYTLKGVGEEVYEPHFTFHGFQYVEVSGYPGEAPGREAITGIVIHSDLPFTGTFVCSDPLINKLQHNIQWSQRDNYLEVPMDCPQRNERLGWTGDAQVFVRTAAFNMDIAGFFTKWLEDMAASQSDLGQIPNTIPSVDTNNSDAGPAWADALLICPWTVYLCYGDTRLLERYYLAFQKFLDYLESSSVDMIRVHPETPWKDGNCEGFGDWVAMNSETPKDLIGTAFFAYSAQLLSRIAGILGKKNDVERYTALFEKVRSAFNRRFVTEDGLIVGASQTAYALALYFDLLPTKVQPVAAKALKCDLERHGYHLTTGFVGTPYVAHALSRCGYLDDAYRLLLQKSWPSWLYAVTQGATTIWERWDGWTREKGFLDSDMNSFNHYAFGSIGEWLYAVVAGIEIDPDQPAYKHILFRPQPGGGLTHARACLRSPYGEIVSEWKIENGQFEYKVVVPPNTTAAVHLPDETADYKVRSGSYTFSQDWPPRKVK